MPTITISINKEEIWLSEDDFDGYETEEYEYEYDYEILQEEIVNAFAEEYDLDFDKAKKIIEDLDLYDTLEQQYEDLLEDVLKERLYDEAVEEWQNNRD